ncbi:MAG: YqgE/AlgH family protein [Verrucomicrobia bacterium]|nr:YqgE/AlgH family protein [Verrucomicrobiota bacterium]
MRHSAPFPIITPNTLLLAHPSLRDPNFSKTVLFLTAHDEEHGSIAFVLNRPTHCTLGEILDADFRLSPLSHLPVFFGGPVATQEIIFASFQQSPQSSKIIAHFRLDIEEVLRASTDPSITLRVFLGYSGWSSGQLAQEFTTNSWLTSPPNPEVIQSLQSPTLWSEIVSTFGPWFKVMALAPDDPSKN